MKRLIIDKKTYDVFYLVRSGNLEAYRMDITLFDINVRDEYRRSLLMEAIANKQQEIALDLISRKINVNLQDYRGHTALHWMGTFPNPIIATEILRNGGDIEIKDGFGNTPLWYAVFHARGNYEMVRFFREHGSISTEKNKAGRSPLDLARQFGDENLIRLLE